MNWQMVGVIVAVLIALTGGIAKVISGLVKNYFETLSKRMDSFEERLDLHTAAEERYQTKVTDMLAGMRDSLIRLDQGKEQFLTLAVHMEAMRSVDKDITGVRHAVRNEIQTMISAHQTDNLSEFTELKRRLEKLEA